MKRTFLAFVALSGILLLGYQKVRKDESAVVNDVHSRLNETKVHRVVQPNSVEKIQEIIRQAKAEGRSISIAGGRHAMGGQQFGKDTILLDTARLDKVLGFDRTKGIIEVQAGIRWPELMTFLDEAQKGQSPQWAIRQKQTGADHLTIGGALSANVHGRGLAFKPFIDDVESFTLVDADGRVRTCSRSQDAELFRLVIGGYGLFGVIADVKLRLVPRRKVERIVRTLDLKDLVPAVEQRIADGFIYGDLQFDIDPSSPDFLKKGVFSCYRPVDDGSTAIPAGQKELHKADWMNFFYLAHKDKPKAFNDYVSYYLSTNGQKYWSDMHQLSEYFDNYHEDLDKNLAPDERGTEMISEIYVPRGSLATFMDDAAKDFREHDVNLIYGTIRFIEKDDESFLAWAKDRYASIIFNLHTAHTPEALDKTARDFRRLIDRAVQYGGRYYLTYHHWATRRQVEASYPQFVDFLKLKRKYDPEERFQSDWYRFYKKMFADAL